MLKGMKWGGIIWISRRSSRLDAHRTLLIEAHELNERHHLPIEPADPEVLKTLEGDGCKLIDLDDPSCYDHKEMTRLYRRKDLYEHGF